MENKTNELREYDLKTLHLPRLSGFPLRLLAWLLESPLRGLILPKLLRDGGITRLRNTPVDDPPTVFPLHSVKRPAKKTARVPKTHYPGPPENPSRGFRFASLHDFARAYREGVLTPGEVAERVLAAVDASNTADPPLGAVIALYRDVLLEQAEASGQRWRQGKPLSAFDGVPVAVKDELDMRPYPTTVGTAFLGETPAREDATVVARLRAAGALLIGKTNMHEIGVGVTGLNPHYGTPRNPYHPGHHTGGSSSGSGAAVAAGLCPVAIGADGGGSIRIPAAFCGVVGLKSTFGRISEYGAAPLCWTVAHLGPLAGSATDAALAYAVMAGPDPRDAHSLRQPAPTLKGWDNPDLSDLTLGVYWPWFRHAASEIVTACEGLLGEFQKMGAQLREVHLPELESGRVAHLITIGAEMSQAMAGHYPAHRREFGLDVRINLALTRQFTARDYLRAQRVRTRVMRHFQEALDAADVIITPTTGLPAPAIASDALRSGESDLSTLNEIIRFAAPANFSGLPAISFPAGYTRAGLPIGLQALGRAWEEPTLLRLARAAETAVPRQKPQLFYEILERGQTPDELA